MKEKIEKSPVEATRRAADAMTARRSGVLAALAFVAFIGLTAVGYFWANNNALATLVELSGNPERDTAVRRDSWWGAQVGDRFEDGDGARTSAHANAQFRMFNGALLSLKPSSKLRFHRRENSESLLLDVGLGEIEVLTGSSPVALGSEFGEVLLDSNSRISMSRQGTNLSVSVVLGSIRLGKNRQKVVVGQTVSLEIGGIVFDPLSVPENFNEPQPVPQEAREVAPPVSKPQWGDGTDRVDVLAMAGDSFIVHDPKPPTAVAFDLKGVCPGAASLSVGASRTEAVNRVSLPLGPGSHRYQLRCLQQPDVVVAKGRVRIIRGSGRRKTPAFAPRVDVLTDGRRYTVMYQSKLPQVTVSWTTAPNAEKYVLEIDDRQIETTLPRHTFASLGQGTHRVAFRSLSSPSRKSRLTTIDVALDLQAPRKTKTTHSVPLRLSQSKPGAHYYLSRAKAPPQ